mmetsp:Transcript_19948/g.31711  ORF Transcript_19948/g.31711 Transcript_19948/m.31711 type:complete len:94 (-) Transcript_19948:75-356(-)
MLNGMAYGAPSDIWNVGVIFHTMLCHLCGYTPYHSERNDTMLENIRSGNLKFFHLSSDDLISTEARLLCSKLLHFHAKKRITAKQALKDAFFE